MEGNFSPEKVKDFYSTGRNIVGRWCRRWELIKGIFDIAG